MKGLKIPNQSIFLSAWSDTIKTVKKNIKNIEKLKIIFGCSGGLDIDGKWAHFMKGLKIPYLSIFFRLYQIILGQLKKIEYYRKI